MDTKRFRTRTVLMERESPRNDGCWGMAVDIGYSGTKVISPGSAACFPSFAIKSEDRRIDIADGEEGFDIKYSEGAGRPTWLVGKCAQDMLSTDDPDSNSMSIYGRKRYYDPMFLVVARTAMGMAMRGAGAGLRPVLQTGLPNDYIKSDTGLLKEVLAGRHVFNLRIGRGAWEHFDITLSPDDVRVIPQPMGTLISIITDDSGATVPGSEQLFASAVLIVDPGFGTTDCFSVRHRAMKDGEVQTFTSISMKEVLRRTSEEIRVRFGVEIPVPMMQGVLESGTVIVRDRKTRGGSIEDISGILEEKNREVAMEAVERLDSRYNGLADFRYLVISGGTGEAWYPYFQEAYGGYPGLEIVPGNRSSSLPFIFSNARGYYMYLHNKLKREAAAAAAQGGGGK